MDKTTRHKLKLGLGILLFPMAIFAQEIPDSLKKNLGTVIIKDYKVNPDQSLKQREIDLDSLQIQAPQNLGEVLKQNTGIFVKSYGGNGVSTLSFRGTGASHTNLYWNDLDITSPTLALADFSVIPTNSANDLSIRYGLASLVDGTGGIGGSLRLNSTVDWKDKFSIEAQQEISSFSHHASNLNLNLGNDKIHSQTEICFQSAKNNFTFPDITQEGSPEEELQHAALTSYGVLQNLNYRVSSSQTLALKAWYHFNDRELPQPLSSTVAKNEEMQDELLNAILQWKKIKPNSQWIANSGYSGSSNKYSNVTDSIFSTNKFHSWQSNLRHKRLLMDNTLKLEGGFYNRLYFIESTGIGESIDQLRSSLFLSAEKNLGKRFGVSILLREELIDKNLSPILGSIGAYANIVQDFKVKLNAARNYRYPSLNDLHWNPGGNPDLKPEESLNIEAGLAYQKHKDNFDFGTEVTAFSNHVDNWILWVPNGNIWSPQNVKKVHNRGLEAETKMAYSQRPWKFSGNFSYAYTLSENKEFYTNNGEGIGKQLIYVPFHKLNGGLKLKYRNIAATYQQFYTSKYFIDTDNRTYMPSYSVADFYLSYEKLMLTQKIDITISAWVKNIYDWKYQIQPYRPEPGRNYGIKLIVQYGNPKSP